MIDSCAPDPSSLVIFLATRLRSAKNHLPILNQPIKNAFRKFIDSINKNENTLEVNLI